MQSHPAPTLQARLRGNILYVIATLIYLASLFSTVYTLEFAYYNQKKWDVMSPRISSVYLNEAAYRRALTVLPAWVDQLRAPQSDPAALATALEDGSASLKVLMDASPAVTAVELYDPSGEQVFRSSLPDRLHTQNHFSNSLIFGPSFQRAVKQSIAYRMTDTSAAYMKIYFTSPVGDPEVESLTALYWKILLFLVAAYTLIYYALLRSILAPLQRVTGFMQRRDQHGSPLISHPGSLIERSYNEIARDATLTRLSRDLRDRVARDGISYAEPILSQIPELIERYMAVEGCQVWTLGRSTSGAWRVERTYSAPIAWLNSEDFGRKLAQSLDETDPFEKPEFWRARVRTYQAEVTRALPFFCDILNVTGDYLWLLVIQVKPGELPPSAWQIDFYARAATELRFALSSIEEQRRLILEEKSKANISLSRNLGHDLTNIIATSKLDLMTIKAFLSLSAAEIGQSPMKEKLFRESLEGLLNNTRFMQEIVNLYRSFSFLQKPKFEETNISELVEDAVRLYRPSLSKSFQIETHLEPEMPVIRIEPRLLRLALFNILNNASDAIKRGGGSEKIEGRIKVSTRYQEDKSRIEITVEDTGPGIRDVSGALMSPDALGEIFRLGFSTKEKQEGEGLGLNWVQTIVRDFHGGEIMAHNREEGGASFTIRLPLVAETKLVQSDSQQNIQAEKAMVGDI
ncbi:hypothetical protein BH09SUM1_BH09SUM1_21460 [soil metagenome]